MRAYAWACGFKSHQSHQEKPILLKGEFLLYIYFQGDEWYEQEGCRKLQQPLLLCNLYVEVISSGNMPNTTLCIKLIHALFFLNSRPLKLFIFQENFANQSLLNSSTLYCVSVYNYINCIRVMTYHDLCRKSSHSFCKFPIVRFAPPAILYSLFLTR